MATGLRIPGSMLRPPSKIGGFTSASASSANTKGGAPNGKRRVPGDADELGAHAASLAELSDMGQARQLKMPSSRLTKPSGAETILTGRRSSQGFTVTPKQNGTAAKLPPVAGGGIRVAPRKPGVAGAPTRLAPNRTSTTRGRVNAGRAGVMPPRSAVPPSDSVKRRRLDAPAAVKPKPAAAGNGAGRAMQETDNGIVSSSRLELNSVFDEDEDDDDDDEEDVALGPPPAIHNRPESDINGRLKDLEEFSKYMIMKNRTARKSKKLLSVELEHNSTQVTQLEFDKSILTTKLETAEKQLQTLQESAAERQRLLQSERRAHEDVVDDIQRKFKRQEEQLVDEQRALKKSISALQDSLESTQARLKATKEESMRLENTVSKQASDQLELESGSRTLKAKAERLEDILSEREIHIAELEEALASRNCDVSELEAKLRTEETTRRRLHNTVQELKGNIRVFCRVRPLVGEEKAMAGALPLSFPECEEKNEIELSQSSENALGKTTARAFPFKFDRVFAPDSTQDLVFDEVSQLIQSALDGYPVCIFAYGQTGSGKTHTMQGPDAITSARPERKILGIIPRAVQQIYDNTSKLAERGWEYTLEGQFLEIYNETLQDLLVPAGHSAQQGGDRQARLEIYQDSEGHTRVKNITTVAVDSAERVHWLLARAAENRTVAATNCNERSSRSHSVFTLYLRGKNMLTGESSSGVLNLIDLAGSERLSSSGSKGDRLKETQAINKSLSSLGDVIAALAKGSRHVPYRNSKLTHLLQESLGGGNSKTLMFVCVNPSPASAQESLCSLQFATKVNSCQIGTAKRQAAA